MGVEDKLPLAVDAVVGGVNIGELADAGHETGQFGRIDQDAPGVGDYAVGREPLELGYRASHDDIIS